MSHMHWCVLTFSCVIHMSHGLMCHMHESRSLLHVSYAWVTEFLSNCMVLVLLLLILLPPLCGLTWQRIRDSIRTCVFPQCVSCIYRYTRKYIQTYTLPFLLLLLCRLTRQQICDRMSVFLQCVLYIYRYIHMYTYIQPIHLECHLIVLSNLNLIGLFSTESSKRDIKN